MSDEAEAAAEREPTFWFVTFTRRSAPLFKYSPISTDDPEALSGIMESIGRIHDLQEVSVVIRNEYGDIVDD